MRVPLLVSILFLTAFAGCLDDATDAADADLPDPAGLVQGTLAHLTDGTVVDLPLNASEVPAMAQRYVAERSAGEPTIAVSREGTAIFPSIAFDFAGGALARTVLYRSQDNGTTWEDVTPELATGQQAQPTSLDPYVYADPDTGRLFTMDLYLGCSNLSWSDDEGDSWTTNPVACGVPVNDHQTLFSGPPVGLTQTVGYPNVLYYCNNQIFESTCSHSLDGGLTFVQGAPVFPGVEAGATEGSPQGVCGGLHGHGHASAATGLVYVPKGHCGQAWVSVSPDNGVTWDMVLVDATVGFDGHEAIVSTDSAGNVYYLFLDEDTLPRLSVSTDGGYTWGPPMLVGHPDVKAAKFPSVVAGDEGRVAFLYVGTTTEDGFQAEGQALLEQTWEAYVGFSFDALSESPTVITTTAHAADDPVKRGQCFDRCFGNDGGMYDFLDIDVHPVTGQVWVALVDLCNGQPDPRDDGPACASAEGTADSYQDARGAVGVQVGGLSLFEAPRE